MYLTLIKTGLIRKRLRTFLTIMSMFIAFLLFGSLKTFSAVFTGTMEGLSADIIAVMPRYDMFGKQPLTTVNYIESIEGVEEVMHMDFLSTSSIESMLEGAVIAVSPSYFDVYKRFEASEEVKRVFNSIPTAAIVGKLLAERNRIKVGDKISYKSSSLNEDGTYNWAFDVVGFYTVAKFTGDEMAIIVNYNFFDEARVSQKGLTSMIMAKIADPALADSISNQIDERFANSSYATRSGPESMLAAEMVGEIADIELIMNGILLSVFFTILLVSANTMAQSIRERTTDLGVLKSLGYKDGQLFTSVILEAVVITFIATTLGLLAVLALIPAVAVASGGLMDNSFSLSATTILSGFAIGLIIAFMSAAVPAYQALNLKVVDALRKA
jgi:putative ABC transport system permease protein